MITISFDPIFLQLGGLQLSWHGLFTALAVAVAVLVGFRIARDKGVPESPLWNVIIWAIIGGLIGARLFHVLDHLSYFAAHPLQAIAVWEGGIAVYGSFIGGIVGGYLAARKYKLSAWPLLDAAAPSALVGQMIGRLGCLSNGDAWGEPTGGSWGLVYANPNDLLPQQLIGVPTHPYPVYEIAACALLLGALWLARNRLTTPGTTFLIGAIGYAVIRFGLSFFRQETIVFGGLQEAQVIALITGAIALAFLLFRRPQPATAMQPQAKKTQVRRKK